MTPRRRTVARVLIADVPAALIAAVAALVGQGLFAPLPSFHGAPAVAISSLLAVVLASIPLALRLSRSESASRRLTESLTDIVFSLDASGRLLSVNAQVERVLGYRPCDIQNKDPRELVPLHRVLPLGAGGRLGEQVFEVEVGAADGRRVVLEVRLLRAAADHGGVAYGVARDVTERREAEGRIVECRRQLRSLASRLALVEARERRRIAAEIHDNIGQSLALARIRLVALADGPLTDFQVEAASGAIALLDGLIRDTRALVFSVSSPLLYEVGLGAALAELVERFSAGQKAAVTYAERGRIPALDVDLAVLLFDAARELVVNAVKHSGAEAIRVTLWTHAGTLNVRVHDNGIGFDVEAEGGRRDGGYGLFSMRERLEHVGATMQIRSRRGRGTWVTVSLVAEGAGAT